MAFCRFCGNQIEDGATCPCQQNAAQNVPEQSVAPAQNASQVAGQAAAMAAKAGTAAKSALNGFIPYVKSYVKAPKATVHDAVVNGKFPIACGFLAINALTVIIAIWSILGSLASLATKGSGYFGAKVDINLPVFRMIFGGILISAAIIVLAAVTLLIFSKVGKSGLTFKGAFIGAAFHSFWPSVLVLGGTIIGLIGGIFGLFVPIMAVSFALQMVSVTAISDARNLGGCDVTSSSGKMFLVPLLLAVANSIISIVVMMLFSWCCGGVEANGVVLGNIFELLETLG